MTINKEAVREWVEALESGRYEQGTGRLRSADDKYCCLGVLCEIAVAKGVIPAPELGPGCDCCSHPEQAYKYGDESGFPPEEVFKWLGGWSEVDGMTLTELNDVNRLPFPEIAALIRRKWLEDGE